MSDGNPWQGNWVARLCERVRERGYDSLTAFAEARPTASLVTLAEELGPDDVAGVQVFTGAALAAGSDLHYVPLRVPARPGGLHPGEARGRLPGPLKS